MNLQFFCYSLKMNSIDYQYYNNFTVFCLYLHQLDDVKPIGPVFPVTPFPHICAIILMKIS